MMSNKWMTVTGLAMAIAWPAGGQTLQFLNTKAEGDGAIQLRWQSETNAVYRIEYRTSLSTSAVWQTLVEEFASHGTNTTFLDTGKYWEEPELKHPVFDSQRYYRVARTGTNTLTPPVVTLSAPIPGSILNGEATITATAVSTNSIAAIKFFVDGEEVEEVVLPAAGTASYTINTTECRMGHITSSWLL